MRRFTGLLLSVSVACPLFAADPNCESRFYSQSPQPTCAATPNCNAPGQMIPSCGCNHPQCRICQGQPCNPKTMTPKDGPDLTPKEGPQPQTPKGFTPGTTKETGFYQAPPRTGSLQGPGRSLGINLGSVTIPEMRLKMPSLELPSVFRSRQTARMSLDSATAPWVSTGFETVGGGVPSNQVASQQKSAGTQEEETKGSTSKSKSAGEADCENVKKEYEAKLKKLESEIKECEKLKECIQECLNKHAQANSASVRQPLRDYATNSEADSIGNGFTSTVPQPISPPKPPPDDARLPPPNELRPASYWGRIEQYRPPVQRLQSVQIQPVRLPAP